MRFSFPAAFLCAACLLPMAAGCHGIGHPAWSPLATLENSLVYIPTKYPDGDWRPVGLPIEDAWFTTPDGTRLHGWYCPHPKPRAVVLFAHGNAGNLSHQAELVRQLHDVHQLSVMTFDYRGYGRSEGEPSEEGILEDARAARSWLAERARVHPLDIVLMGRSLGGGVVVDLAATEGARALILESTFTSLREVAGEHVWLPTKLLMQNRLNSLEKIADYQGPLLISHGDADGLISYEHGQRLFAAANEPKRFVTIAGGDHNDPQTPDYYRALDEFIASLPR